MKITYCLSFMLLTLGNFACASHSDTDVVDTPQNVIWLIGDGCGYNCWEALRLYEDRALLFDNDSRWVHLSMSTYPRTAGTPVPGAGPDTSLIYDTSAAWSALPDSKDHFTGYRFRKRKPTDSAAAATAMSTGVKTYNSAINLSCEMKPLTPITQTLKEKGFSVGVVTSVPLSHATPAGFSPVHVHARTLYGAIAEQAMTSPVLDVLMGAGHPDYDDNGELVKSPDYTYVKSRQFYKRMTGPKSDWSFIDTRDSFRRLGYGETPKRVLGIAPVHQTLTYNRAPKTRPNPAIPTLAEMTAGAINVLDQNPRGFFLMVEGGAIDWANHGNNGARMLEEVQGFAETIQMITAMLDSAQNGLSWKNTLVIVTADHETGLLLGGESDKIPFAPIIGKGKGKTPSMRYHTTNHSNSLVPFWVRGAGASYFSKLPVQHDSVYGPYIDNTHVTPAIFKILRL